MVAAMRTPDEGMDRLRETTGARADDSRLIGVQLDLTDTASIAAAAKMIEETVGAPRALVHNAGISAAGNGRGDDRSALWEKMFQTTSWTGDADQRTAAIHARRGRRANRDGIKRRRCARHAGDRAVLRS